MVEIADIRDAKNLESWLENQPREVSVWIASRAAARVLPVWLQAVQTETWARDGNITALPILRCLLISSVAAKRPSAEIIQAAESAAASASDIPNHKNIAVHTASRAAQVATASVALMGPRQAAIAVATAAVRRDDRMWPMVREDAASSQDGNLPDALPLWPNSTSSYEDEWGVTKTGVAQRDTEGNWQFWLDWYDAQLAGRTMLPDPKRTWEMLEKIALIDPETWDAGPETVNPKIREIWESYKGKAPRELEVLQAADDGIVLGYNVETDRFYQEDVRPEGQSRLQAAVAKLNEVRLLVGQMGNLQGILISEMFLIDRAVQDHPENATMVFFNTKAARGLLQANIENGSCPTPKAEPVIGLLDTMLLDTQNTLLPEPAVQEGLTRRAEDSALLDQPEALQTIEDAAEEIAEVSEGALANELPENAEKAKDSFQPRAVRISALIGTVSAVLQTWIIAGYARFKIALTELDDITTRTARISKNIALIGGTGGAGYGAFQVLTNSPKVEAAIKAIIALF